MINSSKLGAPELFSWGNGIPGELRSFLRVLDAEAKMSRREYPSDGLGKFLNEGVNSFSLQLLDELVKDRSRPRSVARSQSKIQLPKISHALATWIYLLHAYCASWNVSAPPALLWLTFEAFGLKEGRPAEAVEKALGVPVGIQNHDAWFKASLFEGQARANEKYYSLSFLAEQVGVSRPTLRRWRKMPAYIERVKTCEHFSTTGPQKL